MSDTVDRAKSVDLQAVGVERRSEPRFGILLRADMTLPDGSELMGHAVDISHSGMGLYSPMAMLVGQELTVMVPLNVCGERHTVSLTGSVCYCIKQAGGNHRIGLRFVHLNHQTQTFINALCP